MTKVDLVKLIRELEVKESTTNVELDTQQMIDQLVKHGYVVKNKVSYNL